MLTVKYAYANPSTPRIKPPPMVKTPILNSFPRSAFITKGYLPILKINDLLGISHEGASSLIHGLVSSHHLRGYEPCAVLSEFGHHLIKMNKSGDSIHTLNKLQRCRPGIHHTHSAFHLIQVTILFALSIGRVDLQRRNAIPEFLLFCRLGTVSL